MKKHFLFFFRLILVLLIIFPFSSCEKDEFEITSNEEVVQELKNRKAYYNIGNEVSSDIISYLKAKSSNSLKVRFTKNGVALNDSDFTDRENGVLGTVLTDKEIIVINEKNTKHTFDVLTPQEFNSKTNLIVTETANNLYEYFLKYNFNGSQEDVIFSGTIEAFDNNGELIGIATIDNGITTSVEGTLNPGCPEDETDTSDSENNTDTETDNNGLPTGSGIDVEDTTSPIPDQSGGEFENLDEEPCTITYTVQACNRGFTDIHAPRGETVKCSGTIVTFTGCGISWSLASRDSDNIQDPCIGSVGVILTNEELCELSNEDYNAYYSSISPFSVDLSDVRNDCDSISTPENVKFNCIYDKLTKSAKFKHLFNDIFQESENINIKFKIVDSIPNLPSTTKATCKVVTGHTDGNGNLIDLDMEIKIKRFHINNDSRIAVVKSILHECIHAYINLKKIDCQQGTTFEELNNTLLGELINEYYDGACSQGQAGHEFMFDYMLPTMEQVLADVKNSFIPANHQQYVESLNFQSSYNPVVPSTPWDWNQFYYYFSLEGLHNTTAYQQQIATDSIKVHLFNNYRGAGNSFSNSYCQD